MKTGAFPMSPGPRIGMSHKVLNKLGGKKTRSFRLYLRRDGNLIVKSYDLQ